MTLTEFLLARIAEDEALARGETLNWQTAGAPRAALPPTWRPRVLAECQAKRRIVEFHANWPVLVQRPDEFDPSFGAELPLADQMTVRVTRQVAWMTDQKYREAFGDEPPTGSMLLALASVYADHPDYREDWSAFRKDTPT